MYAAFVLPIHRQAHLGEYSSKLAMAQNGDSFFSIAGSQVRMPAGLKPFPSQFAVMSKCISALRAGSNALLESRACAPDLPSGVTHLI